MQFSRSDLADLVYFLSIARHRSFRRAGVELGVTASALSHNLKRLEERLGVRLLNRTNRSVTLTAAGEELCVGINQPIEAVGEAVERLNRFRDAPAGRIRINAPEPAVTLLLAPVLPVFVDRYPGIEVEISMNNQMIDVIDLGFDAGIRFGGTVPEDMVTQRVSAEMRWVVAGSPDYLARAGIPKHPNDLMQHQCLRFRIGDDSIYRWEFEKGEEAFALDVPGAILLNDARVATGQAIAGAGLIYAPEPAIQSEVREGKLAIVLEDWAPIGPAFHFYYTSRRQVPTGLRLLIELVRELRPLGL